MVVVVVGVAISMFRKFVSVVVKSVKAVVGTEKTFAHKPFAVEIVKPLRACK
jgi:hypothetical protein